MPFVLYFLPDTDPEKSTALLRYYQGLIFSEISSMIEMAPWKFPTIETSEAEQAQPYLRDDLKQCKLLVLM